MASKGAVDERVLGVLRASGVFGRLAENVLRDVCALLELHFVPGGKIVYREGDLATNMFFLVSGRLRVSRRDRNGTLQLYNEIRPGESVGEAGLILQQPRAADITALRDSTIAMLSRADFEQLLAMHPLPLNQVFSQAIYNHLRHSSQVVDKRHSQIFMVVPVGPGVSTREVAAGLTRAFAQIGRAYHVAPEVERSIDPDATAGWAGRDRYDELEEQYDYLVYEADGGSSSWLRRSFRQADQVVFVADADASRQVGTLEYQLADEPGYAMKRRHLVLLHAPQTEHPTELLAWAEGRDVERIYPVRENHAGDFGRLARFLTSTAVGVVLGGGGARGFAHLGVLRALEQCGTVIDLIGGNSMGALIGAQYACETSLDDIRERTMRFATAGELPTVPVISLVSGKRVKRDLQRMFGERTVDSTWRPFFAAACNLSRASTMVLETGPMWRSVLASNSPAGLFPPVLLQGDLLVDGAILENVPVRAMRSRLGTRLEQRRGNGTIIAIDVDVQDYMGVDPAMQRLSAWRKISGYFRSGTAPSPGIGDILYRAGHIGGLNQRSRTVAQSDHYLEPPVAAFPLMAYKQAAEIAEVGYRYAMKEIERWDRARNSQT
jgi:predicted acylesterase/phospholipase RssA/CRP-like cAMP-binding protein